jgi:uncharacterized protein with HEPN domain
MSNTNNEKLVLDTLEEIKESILLIQRRFKPINSSDDFLESEDGIDKLDAIAMRLVAIGEGFKNINKLTDNRLLKKYDSIDFKGVKSTRDILSHHYFDIDAEIIYNICDNYIDELLDVTIKMIEEYK